MSASESDVEPQHVLVVGGGVIGLACAHYLVEAGRRVTIIDRDRIGAACSQGNCGLVCPSHVLPLAEPGALRDGVSALFRRRAPLSIKPGFNLELWAWLYQFSRRCNSRDQLASGRAIQPLLAASLDLYQSLIDETGLECEWQRRGLLFVYKTPAAMESYSATNDLLSKHFDAAAQRYDGIAVRELEPALKAGLAGAWFYDHDAHLRPDKLMASWRAHLESRGVTIHENCAVQEIRQENGRAVKLMTDSGELTADAYVVATGALTPKLSRWLGCKIPIQPGKGYSITMPRPAVCPQIPMLLPEERVAVTPMETGYRLGSVMEFVGYDSTIPQHRLDYLKRGAEQYLQEPYCDPVEHTWYGWRPMTYDSQPIIDRSPTMSNLWIAAGHNMLGLSMAPATGRLIAELVTDRPTSVDAGPYSLQRF